MRISAFTFALLACVSPVLAQDVISYAPVTISPAEQERRDRANEVAKAITERKVIVGMTAEQCRQAWGQPTRINRTTNVNGVSEQWVYESQSSALNPWTKRMEVTYGPTRYLHLDSDILFSISN